MPRTTITPDGSASGAGAEKFPQLKMTQKGQTMRVAALETEEIDGVRQVTPWYEWAHQLKAPVIQDGQALKRKIKTRTGEQLAWDLEFKGGHICLGDKEVLRTKGMDPENCPTCEAARLHKEIAQFMPEVRYAMNVLVYSTQHGGWQFAQPFGASVLVWAFPASRFAKLVTLQQKLAGEGRTLLDVDLALGPCDDPGYQRYEIDALRDVPGWRLGLDQGNRAFYDYCMQVWAVRATDEQLRLACGTPKTNRDYIRRDIEETVKQWAIAKRQDGTPLEHDPFGSQFTGQPPMQQGIAGLMDELGQPGAAPLVPPPAAPSMDWGGMNAAPAPGTAAPAAPAPQPGFAPITPPGTGAPVASPGGLEHFAPQAPAAPGDALAQAMVPPTAPSPSPVMSPPVPPATPMAPPAPGSTPPAPAVPAVAPAVPPAAPSQAAPSPSMPPVPAPPAPAAPAPTVAAPVPPAAPAPAPAAPGAPPPTPPVSASATPPAPPAVPAAAAPAVPDADLFAGLGAPAPANGQPAGDTSFDALLNLGT